MSFWKRLFGGGSEETSAPAEEPQEHKGYTITPEPIRDGAHWRVAARIEKDGHRHDLIRADTFGDRAGAVDASVLKAKQVIDEQGDRMFD